MSSKDRIRVESLGVSLVLEWKTSIVRKESRRATVRGSVNRSFHTGRVEPDSSDFFVSSFRVDPEDRLWLVVSGFPVHVF